MLGMSTLSLDGPTFAGQVAGEQLLQRRDRVAAGEVEGFDPIPVCPTARASRTRCPARRSGSSRGPSVQVEGGGAPQPPSWVSWLSPFSFVKVMPFVSIDGDVPAARRTPREVWLPRITSCRTPRRRGITFSVIDLDAGVLGEAVSSTAARAHPLRRCGLQSIDMRPISRSRPVRSTSHRTVPRPCRRTRRGLEASAAAPRTPPVPHRNARQERGHCRMPLDGRVRSSWSSRGSPHGSAGRGRPRQVSAMDGEPYPAVSSRPSPHTPPSPPHPGRPRLLQPGDDDSARNRRSHTRSLAGGRPTSTHHTEDPRRERVGRPVHEVE